MKSAEELKSKELPCVKRLIDLLNYDKETGELTWAVNRGKVKKGDIAGTTNPDGYRQIQIEKRIIPSHRIAWAIVHGEYPDNLIDHINCDRLDNRLCNLRQANKSLNGLNRGKPSNNTSGYKGVVFCKTTGRWRSRLKVDGKVVNIGRFNTKVEAAIAYMTKAKELAGEFARC